MSTISAVRRRLQILRERQKEQKKELEKAPTYDEKIGRDRICLFFDTVAPTVPFKVVEETVSVLSAATALELPGLLKKFSRSKNEKFIYRTSKIIKNIGTTRRMRIGFSPFPSPIKLMDFRKTLIAAKKRAIEQQKKRLSSDEVMLIETPQQLKTNATNAAKHFMKNLPARSLEELHQFFETYAVTKEEEEEDPCIPELSPHIETITKENFHLVAVELANFFPFPDGGIVTTLGPYLQSQERWNTLRESFIATILKVHERLQSKEELALELIDVDNPEQKIISKVKRKVRTKPPRHVCFRAVPLKDIQHEPMSRTVLIDNLPIDIEQERLRSLFSRCGELDDVQIFQQRPELDPGRLTIAEIAALRKKRIQSLSSSRWTRPHTPVYALVTFADDAGYEEATDKSLQLFGMLIDRHAARSKPGETLTSLFIDDIDMGISALEKKLGEHVQDHFAVCLDAGQSNRGQAQSCEISFPSFESAYSAYNLLTGKYNVNWIKTPDNAMDWWTRKLGFD